MNGLKQTVFSAAASLALLGLPISPVAAHEHFHGGPCIVGNVIGAVATLVTLPLVVAAAAISVLQPQAQYSPAPGYGGGPAGYYAQPGYYAPPSAYYAQSPRYYPAPQTYYRPAPGYVAPAPQYPAPTRGYYAPRPTYAGSYGAPGRSPYRGW